MAPVAVGRSRAMIGHNGYENEAFTLWFAVESRNEKRDLIGKDDSRWLNGNN